MYLWSVKNWRAWSQTIILTAVILALSFPMPRWRSSFHGRSSSSKVDITWQVLQITSLCASKLPMMSSASEVTHLTFCGAMPACAGEAEVHFWSRDGGDSQKVQNFTQQGSILPWYVSSLFLSLFLNPKPRKWFAGLCLRDGPLLQWSPALVCICHGCSLWVGWETATTIADVKVYVLRSLVSETLRKKFIETAESTAFSGFALVVVGIIQLAGGERVPEGNNMLCAILKHCHFHVISLANKCSRQWTSSFYLLLVWKSCIVMLSFQSVVVAISLQSHRHTKPYIHQ